MGRPIYAVDAVPGTRVGDSRVLHKRVTIDGSYPQVRIVLRDLRTITVSYSTMIQQSSLKWQNPLDGPDNPWDRNNSEARPEHCPGCRLPGTANKNWVFREGGMQVISTGGDSYQVYRAGVWECVNCAWQPLTKFVQGHPANT